MRTGQARTGTLLACAAAAAGAWVAAASDPDPAPAATGPVLDVGDSLSIGTTPYIRRELGVPVTNDGRVGRPSSEAVGVLRGLLGSQRVVVFDAGVNDDPGQPSRLASDLASVRSIVGGRCLVVATLSRPPFRGVTVDGLNRAVRQFAAGASNVRLVDWRSAALANPGLMNSDGVHPTPSGYALRGRLFAHAIESCATGAPPVGPGVQSPAAPAVPSPPRARRPKRPHRPKPAPPRRPAPAPKPPPELGSQSGILTDEPVSIASRGARLSGELIAPAGGSRHPAVVMIQGAGPATREPYREQAEFLAQHGVAALIYDKRGSGESTGDPDYRYADLAGDVRAAIAMLRTRPEVRPDAIGLWGLSEGGSVAALVAAGDPQVTAVMAISASAIAPASQEDWAVRRALSAAGAGTGTAAVTRYYAVAGELGAAGLAGGRDRDLRFDPAPEWRRVAQPVLAMWGSADTVVPARDSAKALASALAAGGVNRDRTFRTFPGANHSLGVASEAGRPGSAPGFKELSATWLRAHLSGHPPAPAIVTPLPRRSGPPVQAVQRASLLERWPVQLGWLLLPALALALAATRAWRRRRREGHDEGEPAGHAWRWPAAVAALDALAVAALAYAVAALVEEDGQHVQAVAGVPVVVAVTWAIVLAGAIATGALARRCWRSGGPARTVCLAGLAWLLLVAYWLV
jgi:dienelactone hydrolase